MIRSSSMGCGRGRLPACPFSKKSKEIDMTPDNLKYGHTPTGPEVIAGVTLKDAKRASKWPAYVDVAQSVTGLLLGLFLFCHMAFTSSIQVGKDLFWNLIQVSGGTPIFGHEQTWLHFLFVGVITLLVIIHALCALRRFPTSYKQFRDIRAHVNVVHHTDSTLWFIQFVTAIILTGMVFPHVMTMLTNPGDIEPNLSSVHTYHNGLIWTLIFLVATELHGMIGLYRLAVKWDVIKGRAGLRKTMLVIAFLMICCGSLTAYTFWSNGKELVDNGQAATRHVPTVNWFADK